MTRAPIDLNYRWIDFISRAKRKRITVTFGGGDQMLDGKKDEKRETNQHRVKE